MPCLTLRCAIWLSIVFLFLRLVRIRRALFSTCFQLRSLAGQRRRFHRSQLFTARVYKSAGSQAYGHFFSSHSITNTNFDFKKQSKP